jgi:small conductance mechanosensitive channel
MDLDKFYDKFYNWLISFGPRLLLAIAVLVIGLWITKWIKKWLNNHFNRKSIDPSIKSFLFSLLVTALKVLVILGAMQILGVQMTVFAALVGGIGVAAGLALSGTLQNFTSGILILMLKPYKVGDNIVAQGQEGTVSSIQLFYTVVITFDNKTVIVPNSKLSNEVIINLSREGTRRLDVEFKFNFGFDPEQVMAVMNKTIHDNKDLLQVPPSRVGITQIDNDGYKIAVQAWTNAHGFLDVRMILQQKLIHDLKAAGIKLPGMQ